MSTRNSRKKTRINSVGSIDDRGSQSNNDFDSISPESCHYITREQAYSGNEIAYIQEIFRTGEFYNKHTCREVSPGLDARGWLDVSRTYRAKRGDFGKLPATRCRSNPGLTEPENMFGFYPIHRAIHSVALCDIFVDVLSTFSRPKKSMGSYNTSLSTSRLTLLHFFFGFSSVPVG
jgi:hypothetical protein